MIAVLFFGLVRALAQPGDPHVIETHTVEMTPALRGRDFLLIVKAAKHPEMRRRDLSCYKIFVTTEHGVRTVRFLGVREALPRAKKGEIILGFPKQNIRCPDRSFVMDEKGRVIRVFYSRD